MSVSLRAVDENTRRAVALSGQFTGQQVVVVGSSPQLNQLSDDDWAWVHARPMIGVNRVQYACTPDYLLSAYSHEVEFGMQHDPAITGIHMRQVYDPVISGNCITLLRTRFSPERRLEPRLRPPRPTVRTLDNVALGATHLALMLGASEIVYIGVEQRTKEHFFDRDQAVRDDLIRLLREFDAKGRLSADHPWDLDLYLQAPNCDADEMARTPFYEVDHRETFEAYFRQLATFGVKPIATLRESIVADAGAEVRTLAELRAAG